MTIKELKAILNDYDENETICIKCENDSYLYSPDSYYLIDGFGVRSFWGRDYKCLLLNVSQVGACWNIDDLNRLNKGGKL